MAADGTPVSDPWTHHMLRGEFAEAWAYSDAVLKARAGVPCWHLPRHRQYIWDGTPLDGKRVLIRCYHGLGDTIQFIRFAPLVKAVAKEVIVWAQPELIPLLQTAAGIDRLLPLHDGTPEAEYDVDAEIMELSHVFRITCDRLPLKIPYLEASPLRLGPEDGSFNVGLVWRAGDWDERRSIPFAALAPLGDVPGVRLYILQRDADQHGWREGFGIHPGEFALHEYARVIRGLDLVISVDSMPAHLAGALGVPVWNLLHAEADWRWMRGRDDSPWYPGMRLFRQERQGEWEDVIGRVTAALRLLAGCEKAPLI